MGKIGWKRGTNLENLKPEELDNVYQNVASAVNWLHKAVKERRIKEVMDEMNQR